MGIDVIPFGLDGDELTADHRTRRARPSAGLDVLDDGDDDPR